MDNKNNVPNLKQIGNELIKNASRIAASESVKFFKKSFTDGGFTDASFQKWQQTNNPLAGKHTMYRQGNLMRSIHKQSATTSKIIVVSDTDYSEIHNSGGTITVTKQMKKFFWAKYYEITGIVSKKKGGDGQSWSNIKTSKRGYSSLSKANAGISAKAKFCKRIAMMPVGSKIKIPKRQFMGNSQTMMNIFNSKFSEVIIKQVEPQFNNPTVTITVTDI